MSNAKHTRTAVYYSYSFCQILILAYNDKLTRRGFSFSALETMAQSLWIMVCTHITKSIRSEWQHHKNEASKGFHRSSWTIWVQLAGVRQLRCAVVMPCVYKEQYNDRKLWLVNVWGILERDKEISHSKFLGGSVLPLPEQSCSSGKKKKLSWRPISSLYSFQLNGEIS